MLQSNTFQIQINTNIDEIIIQIDKDTLRTTLPLVFQQKQQQNKTKKEGEKKKRKAPSNHLLGEYGIKVSALPWGFLGLLNATLFTVYCPKIKVNFTIKVNALPGLFMHYLVQFFGFIFVKFQLSLKFYEFRA